MGLAYPWKNLPGRQGDQGVQEKASTAAAMGGGETFRSVARSATAGRRPDEREETGNAGCAWILGCSVLFLAYFLKRLLEGDPIQFGFPRWDADAVLSGSSRSAMIFVIGLGVPGPPRHQRPLSARSLQPRGDRAPIRRRARDRRRPRRSHPHAADLPHLQDLPRRAGWEPPARHPLRRASPEPGRPTWRRRWPPKPAFRSSSSPPPRSTACSTA